MKIQVKGLMFVGAAAAIMLSAGTTSAFAADENVVTSKAYTEATYQHLLPYGDGHTGKVIVAGSQKNQVTEKEIDTTVTAESPNLVTSGAVAAAISAEGVSGKQTASTANFQIGGENGSWKTVTPGTNVGLTAGDNNTVNLTVAQTSSLANAGSGGADEGKLITAGAVYTGLDGKVTKNAAITGATKTKITYDAKGLVTGGADLAASDLPVIGAAPEGNAASADAGKILVVGNDGKISVSASGASGTYQPVAGEGVKVGNNGSWDTLDATGYLEQDTTTTGVVAVQIKSSKVNNSGSPLATATSSNDSLVTDYTLTSGLNTKQNASEKATSIVKSGEGANNDNNHFPTNAAVITYVDGVLNTMPIPATVPDGCKVANAHCALVTSYANNTLSTAWTVMAGAEGGNN